MDNGQSGGSTSACRPPPPLPAQLAAPCRRPPYCSCLVRMNHLPPNPAGAHNIVTTVYLEWNPTGSCWVRLLGVTRDVPRSTQGRTFNAPPSHPHAGLLLCVWACFIRATAQNVTLCWGAFCGSERAASLGAQLLGQPTKPAAAPFARSVAN